MKSIVVFTKYCLILFTILVYQSCNPSCEIAYATEDDYNKNIKHSTLGDSILEFYCLSWYAHDKAINLHYNFMTKEIYNIDSLNINIILDNGKKLVLNQISFQVEDNKRIGETIDSTYIITTIGTQATLKRIYNIEGSTLLDEEIAGSLNPQKVILKYKMNTKRRITKWSNEKYWDFEFHGDSKLTAKFINVYISFLLINNNRTIRYNKQCKLMLTKNCYID